MSNEIKCTASESIANYASMNKELRAAEVNIDELKDAIQEAEDNGNQQKADRLRRHLNVWKAQNVVLEGMLHDTACDAAAAKEAIAQAEETKADEDGDNHDSSSSNDNDNA